MALHTVYVLSVEEDGDGGGNFDGPYRPLVSVYAKLDDAARAAREWLDREYPGLIAQALPKALGPEGTPRCEAVLECMRAVVLGGGCTPLGARDDFGPRLRAAVIPIGGELRGGTADWAAPLALEAFDGYARPPEGECGECGAGSSPFWAAPCRGCAAADADAACRAAEARAVRARKRLAEAEERAGAARAAAPLRAATQSNRRGYFRALCTPEEATKCVEAALLEVAEAEGAKSAAAAEAARLRAARA